MSPGMRQLPARCLALAIAAMAGLALHSAALAQIKTGPGDKDEATRQLEQKRRELDDARNREKSLTQDIDAIGKERARLNEQLIQTAERVQKSEVRLSEIEERIEDLMAREGTIRGSIEQRHEAIGKLLAAMQRLGRQPPPALITRRDDALAMVRSAMMMASIYPELKQQADRLSADLDDLLKLERDMTAQGESLKRENKTFDDERTRIKTLLAEKRKSLAEREGELAEVRRAAETHAKEVAQLGDLLARMGKELAKTPGYDAEAGKKPGESGLVELAPSAKTVAFVNPGRIKPATSFAAAKGTLRYPAKGSVRKVFGAADGFGGNTKGISLATRGDAQITAPCDGWVAYADEFRGYGKLLIIDAGGGYHVLLAGMGQIDVSVGQFVLAGEPVAVMGAGAPQDAKRESQPALYVEFRKDGQPIDPDPWWARGPQKVQG